MSKFLHAGEAKAIAAEAILEGKTQEREKILQQVREAAAYGKTYTPLYGTIMQHGDKEFFERLGYQIDPGFEPRMIVPPGFNIETLTTTLPIIELADWGAYPREQFIEFPIIYWK